MGPEEIHDSHPHLTASLSLSPTWNCRLKLLMGIRGFSTGVCMEILNWFFCWSNSIKARPKFLVKRTRKGLGLNRPLLPFHFNNTSIPIPDSKPFSYLSE
jgi:hypothetical protein